MCQFDVKEGRFTTICENVLKTVVKYYYTSRGSYVLLNDEVNMCIVNRVTKHELAKADWCNHQAIAANWQIIISGPFGSSN